MRAKDDEIAAQGSLGRVEGVGMCEMRATTRP